MMRNCQTKAMAKWSSLEEAAQYLNTGKPTLYNLGPKGKVPAHKIGREWRFDGL